MEDIQDPPKSVGKNSGFLSIFPSFLAQELPPSGPSSPRGADVVTGDGTATAEGRVEALW